LKTIREVGAASAPDLNQLALLPGEDAEAVVLDFVPPSPWRGINERRFARADEAGRNVRRQRGWGRARIRFSSRIFCNMACGVGDVRLAQTASPPKAAANRLHKTICIQGELH
jgi:hypothetical protein